jgi:excisionase family DNA binding protein
MSMAKTVAAERPELVDVNRNTIREVPEFLNRRDVAKLFGVSASTITRWARTGLITALRTPGGHYRYRAEDVGRAARSSAGRPVAVRAER